MNSKPSWRQAGTLPLHHTDCLSVRLTTISLWKQLLVNQCLFFSVCICVCHTLVRQVTDEEVTTVYTVEPSHATQQYPVPLRVCETSEAPAPQACGSWQLCCHLITTCRTLHPDHVMSTFNYNNEIYCVCYLTSTRDHEVTTGQQLSSEAAAVTGVLEEIHIQQSHLHSTGVHTGHTWCQHAQLHADRTFPYVLTGNCKLQKWQPESDKLFREVLNSLWIFIIYDWALIQVGLGNADFGHTTGKKAVSRSNIIDRIYMQYIRV